MRVVCGSGVRDGLVAAAVKIAGPVREQLQLRQSEPDLVVDERVLAGLGSSLTKRERK